MLADTLQITYDSATVDLKKVKEGGYASEYFAESGDDKLTLEVKHTIPAPGGSGESHLLKLTVQRHTAEGLYMRSDSAWVVIKTFDGPQDTDEAALVAEALTGLAASGTMISDLAGRQS